MHEFRVDERRTATRSARIGDVLTEIGDSLTYTYDLGDGWEHGIVLEKRSAGNDDADDPVCVDGQQACPPEDCGGVPGYYGREWTQRRLLRRCERHRKSDS